MHGDTEFGCNLGVRQPKRSDLQHLSLSGREALRGLVIVLIHASDAKDARSFRNEPKGGHFALHLAVRLVDALPSDANLDVTAVASPDDRS